MLDGLVEQLNSLFLTLTNTKLDDTVSSDCIEPEAPVDIALKKRLRLSESSAIPILIPSEVLKFNALAFKRAIPTSGKNLPQLP